MADAGGQFVIDLAELVVDEVQTALKDRAKLLSASSNAKVKVSELPFDFMSY